MVNFSYRNFAFHQLALGIFLGQVRCVQRQSHRRNFKAVQEKQRRIKLKYELEFVLFLLFAKQRIHNAAEFLGIVPVNYYMVIPARICQ